VIVSQPSWETAIHAQPVPAVTLKLRELAPFGIVCDDGDLHNAR
jgi:hypothetical protein